MCILDCFDDSGYIDFDRYLQMTTMTENNEDDPLNIAPGHDKRRKKRMIVDSSKSFAVGSASPTKKSNGL